MNDKDEEAFEKWVNIEFGEDSDKNRAYLYEKSIFRFAWEYKDKELNEWKEAARSEAQMLNEERERSKELAEWLRIAVKFDIDGEDRDKIEKLLEEYKEK